MKIKVKDKYIKIKNIWMKNPKIFIITFNKSKKIQYLSKWKIKKILLLFIWHKIEIYIGIKRGKKVINE